MNNQRFQSPREESLEIAMQTRRMILDGKSDTVSVLRACLVIAKNLNKKGDIKWITSEFDGYCDDDKLPSYRKFSTRTYDQYGSLRQQFEPFEAFLRVHVFVACSRSDQGLDVDQDSKTYYLSKSQLETILARVIDRCLLFLSDTISELQYGGVVEYMMEEIRKKSDEKLFQLDNKLTDESKSLFENLTSTNPADWNKVGHSSRKMLSLLADRVFQSSDEKYTLKNGKTIEVGTSNYINRLVAFLDQKVSGEEERLIDSEIEYLACYLRRISDVTQVVEHAPSIDKYHANMLAIHTYLIISEIIRHIE
jgi:hypothetical protein